jgi:hypothetical protein
VAVSLPPQSSRKDLQIELQKELSPIRSELAGIKADVLVLKWMVGAIVAGVFTLVAKAFLQS